MAQHDALTDLPNRTLLRDRLRREIARARRGDRAFALHVIDLDGFKSVNDLLGHSVGDKYLRTIAERLRAIARDTDTVARLGGDEFAILQTQVTRSEDAAELAALVIKSVAEPCLCSGERLALSASVGITIHPTDGADDTELFKNADLAMYRAKTDGGNLYRFYAADMNTRAREAAALDGALREAIEKEQFLLFYQPQVETATGRIVGAEALLRWDRPGCGIVSPGEFLARAEDNGLILPINEWVLREACREARSWRRSGLPPLRISVNLSPVQFRKQSVPLLVAKVLADTGLEPWLLDLELTESIMLRETEVVAKDLRQLQDLGVSISIDDFGTGYSSLSYVKRFPVDRLKIDQCFVRDLTENPNDAAIVRAMVSLGQSLELKVVAEGVESAEQLALLRAEGCDEAQGYYFGKPMPAAQFVALARESMPLALTA
jgi:diguanylate cyclase (GGDEF)-like protein